MALLTLEGDVKVRTFRPPPRFNPLTASAAQLRRYGFPARPDDPHLLERYQRVLNRLKGKFQYIEPTFQVGRSRPRSPPERPSVANKSFNWSGGVVNAPAGQSFVGIQADWVIPNVYPIYPLTQNFEYLGGIWIGLDGYGVSTDLCQAGVLFDASTLGGQINRKFCHFWEWVPSDPRIPSGTTTITDVSISAGDFVTLAICVPGGAGSRSARVYFTNNTSGHSTSYEIHPPDPPSDPIQTKLVGNCAEWIVEMPIFGASNSTLPDYGEVFFSSCEAYLASTGTGTVDTTVGGGTGDSINLLFPWPDGNVISQATLIPPNIIQCSYVGAPPP
jgi:hypothetical protein